MNLESSGDLTHPRKIFHSKAFWGGIIFFILLLLLIGILWLTGGSAEARVAPEAQKILDAQKQLPFQILIPAYLPRSIVRAEAVVDIDNLGPEGQPMAQIVYPSKSGGTLTFYEWLPTGLVTAENGMPVTCPCMSGGSNPTAQPEGESPSLRVVGVVSSPNLLTGEEARSVLDTLGPATNSQIFTSLKAVPLSYSLPPAEEIPINADGVQEMTLIVTSSGYSPEHFSVQKDIPVKLTFRQLGQVGCGNELIFQWGKNDTTVLYLAFSSDSQILEFTPEEAGEFRFYCPHYIYRGVMTVRE